MSSALFDHWIARTERNLEAGLPSATCAPHRLHAA
ncbi:geranyl transferase, partial [Xanthomonas oryzae pv. oryzae]